MIWFTLLRAAKALPVWLYAALVGLVALLVAARIHLAHDARNVRLAYATAVDSVNAAAASRLALADAMQREAQRVVDSARTRTNVTVARATAHATTLTQRAAAIPDSERTPAVAATLDAAVDLTADVAELTRVLATERSAHEQLHAVDTATIHAQAVTIGALVADTVRLTHERDVRVTKKKAALLTVGAAALVELVHHIAKAVHR